MPSCRGAVPDFKTELPEIADYLLNAHLARAERTRLDGFRLDTVKRVSHDFWQEHRRRTRAQVGPKFFLIGEVWGGDAQSLDPWFAGDEMDAGFDFSFQGSTLGWLQGHGRTGLRRLFEVAREGARGAPALALPLLARRPRRAARASWRRQDYPAGWGRRPPLDRGFAGGSSWQR
jgi:glycosidase